MGARHWLWCVNLVLCLGVLGAVQAGGQTAAQTGSQAGAVRTWASKSTVTVGDTLTYHVDVIAPDSTGVLFGAPASKLGEFESLQHIIRPKQELVGGMTLWGEDYVVAVYSPGVHSIPPVQVTVVAPDGEMWALLGDTLKVAVASVLGDGEETLRDIKGIVSEPARGLWPWIVVAGVGGALALVLWLWVRRRRRIPTLVRSAAPVPPDVAALRRLDGLLKARLLEAGRFKAFYTELSDILRDYIYARFSLPAGEMTTAELTEGMERSGLSATFRCDTCFILDESDMVKFAKVTPGIENAYGTAVRAKTLIERSGPRDELEPEALAS
jgi:hypothetical protein